MSSAFNMPPHCGLSKNIYERVDFLISSETKDLSPCIFSMRPFLTHFASVVSAGYFPRLLLVSQHSKLVAAGSGQNKCGPIKGLIGRSRMTQELFCGGLSGNELTILRASTLLHYLIKNPRPAIDVSLIPLG